MQNSTIFEEPAELHISDKDHWIDLRSAVARVQQHTGLSTGAAQVLLHKACTSGEVRSRGRDLFSLGSRGKEGLLPLLSEKDWQGKSINLDAGDLEDPDGIFSVMNVTVSAEDLDWWVRNRWNPGAAAGRRLGRGSGERTDNATDLATHADEADAAFMRTGAPGRPTKGMHILRAEFDRRLRANECQPSLREEATELEEWFRNKFPAAQPVKLKTIENNIRADYRNWAADRRSREQ